MKNICIQSGHWNVKTGQTGAPMEQVRTLAIGLKLVDLLRKQGYNVYHTDSYADKNPDVTGKDWDLFLSLHCDANYAGDEGGGFVDYPDPSIDSSNKESKRIKEAIESVYFKETGIRNVPSRSNANTKFYYMWAALSAKTPCVIIEMGESIDPHDSVILNDTERVAKALLNGINKAFPGVVTPEIPSDPCADVKRTLALTEQDNTTKQAMIDDLKSNLSASNSKLKPLQERNAKLEAFVQSIKELTAKV